MISLQTNSSILIGVFVVFLFLILGVALQKIKIRKQKRKLEKESKRLNLLKKKASTKYEDFTDGHLYQ
ncbi:MAG: hypothetical protein BM549_01370 [Lacinutrix sp. MedPE-SW]|nr:MAG: hypothetical protein BM549_01370 [Lacinutrix sp. MedPE-SW]